MDFHTNSRMRALLLPCLIAALAAGDASAYDLGTCPMDALKFVHPESKAQFRPDRVGTDLYFACGVEEEITKEPANPADCLGPYGDIMLEGTFNGNGHEDRLIAVYSLHKGTVPCCGWSVFGADENAKLEERTDWLRLGAAPKLSEWPFASIYNDWGSRDDLNGVVAQICDPGVS